MMNGAAASTNNAYTDEGEHSDPSSSDSSSSSSATTDDAASVAEPPPPPPPIASTNNASLARSVVESFEENQLVEGAAVGNEVDDVATSRRWRWVKQRNSPHTGDVEVGAVQVHEQAPQVNRRYYLGLDRASVILRRRQARQERARRRRQEAEAEEGGGGNDSSERHGVIRRMSTLPSSITQRMSQALFAQVTPAATTSSSAANPPAYSSSRPFMVTARLVEENEGDSESEEVVMAERVGFAASRWKRILALSTMLLSAGLVAMAVIKYSKEIEEAPTANVEVFCEPCINRSKFNVRAIVHHENSDSFRRAVASAQREAKGMGVHIVMHPFVEEGGVIDNNMANEIRRSVEPNEGVDALIVTIPSKIVANAVQYAAGKGMPVFGLKSGFHFASGLIADKSLLFFTSSDDRLGGERAASYFLEEFALGTTYDDAAFTHKRALFVSPPSSSNSVYQQRFEGYRNRLETASNDSIKVEWVQLPQTPNGTLTKVFTDCPYHFVLIGSSSILPRVKFSIHVENECSQSKVGSFGSSNEARTLLEKGLMEFVIETHDSLQGWFSAHFAALHATTRGRRGRGLVVLPSSDEVYLAGPILLTKRNYTEIPRGLNCREKGSQDCPNIQRNSYQWDLPPVCECSPRNSVVIGAVVHGDASSKFWNTVKAGANQAAADVGINLVFELFEQQGSVDFLYKLMSDQILRYCTRMHGMFVTLAGDIVVEAVKRCQVVNPEIKIVSINVGYEESKELNLIHHIGMGNIGAGYKAGKKMAKMAMFNQSLCLNNRPYLDRRCEGFEKAMKEKGIAYSALTVPEDNMDDYGHIVETAVAQSSGNWDNFGIILAGEALLPGALALKKEHTNLLLATFETDEQLHAALASDDVLFGVDDQPYLQGYLAPSILKQAITTRQYFLNHLIKTGPEFVIEPLTTDEISCNARDYPVCEHDTYGVYPTKQPVTPQPSTSGRPSFEPTFYPSISFEPSLSPSFIRGPTLDNIQRRGHIRCGMSDEFRHMREISYDLCRAVTAVLFGVPDNHLVGVPVTASDRFEMLQGRDIDLLMHGDTHTIEREIHEVRREFLISLAFFQQSIQLHDPVISRQQFKRTTGAGFAFSSPIFYDGLAYFGNSAFVRCAEKQMKYDACSSLRLCAVDKTTSHEFVRSSFPSDFFTTAVSHEQMEEMLWNGTCNVIASDMSRLMLLASSVDEEKRGMYVVGTEMMTKEPLAIATRNSDREFSDIVNWVVQALFFGEEQGLAEDPRLCEVYRSSPTLISDLIFLNAVHCVGNYGEILPKRSSMNQINDGSTGMIYATPFGDLDTPSASTLTGTLLKIYGNGMLNCGVMSPDDSAYENLVGMSIDYCRALAAALFNGNSNSVILSFSESYDDAFVALNSGAIDVLAGAKIDKHYDFGSPTSGGFHFSTPYYFGNETTADPVSFFTLATREEDPIFSSFVNCVVLVTIYAAEKSVNDTRSGIVPLTSVFGNTFKFALRDAISYSGNYDHLYGKHFGSVAGVDRGRNELNRNRDPQIHSFPGLLNHVYFERD